MNLHRFRERDMAIITNPAVDNAVASATSLPDLAKQLAAVDPALAAQLETKPLAASRTPWGTLAVAIVAYVASRYGLHLDEATTGVIAGVAVLAGSYAMRLATSRRIAGVFAAPAVAPPASVAPDVTPVT